LEKVLNDDEEHLELLKANYKEASNKIKETSHKTKDYQN